MASYYNIDDGFGNRITAGLQAHEARRVAKRIANERGEPVFLYEAGEGEAEAEMEEITPSKKPSRHHTTKKPSPRTSKKTWHIFETGRATGDRWVAGPYVTKRRAEELALRYMTDPPGRDSLRRSGVYIVKDHGP